MDMTTISRAFFSPDHPAGSGTMKRAESNAEEELCLQTRGILGAHIDEGGAFEGAIYHEFGPSAHGGFIISKRLERDAVCCVFAEPMGRGPRAALLGAYLKGALSCALSSGLLKNAVNAPANALARLDMVLENALDALAIPGAMVAMSAVIANARDSRVTVLCRGTGGVAAVRSNGTPAWMDGGAAPLFGVMSPGFMQSDFMPGTASPKPRTYTFMPGDEFVLVNGQFDDIPGLASIAAKGIVPVLAARAKRGGKLSAGGVTLDLPPPEAIGPAVPERMALALHALRLAGLKQNTTEPRITLVLEAEQAAYFESICRASGIEVPLAESGASPQINYAAAAPLNAKPPLAFLLHRA